MGGKATAEQFEQRLAARRRNSAFEALAEAIDESAGLEIPPTVERIVERKRGTLPLLPVEAFELARQVYYLQHGTRRDAARAVIAAGLTDTDDLTSVYERLKTWWDRERWPLRSTTATFAIRDAAHDGGLYRSEQICRGVATGSGPAPKGKPCTQSCLPDSDYCFHHDPRPEYVEKRRVQTLALVAGRRANLVPVDPFRDWCLAEGKRLVGEARERGQAHPNERNGLRRLSLKLGIDNALLGRVLDTGKTSTRREVQAGVIRASTVEKYLRNVDATFRDIYGFDPPARVSNREVCPECGGPKDHSSKLCRVCYERTVGDPCPYVNTRGETCGIPTHQPYCAKHLAIVRHRMGPKLPPKKGKKGAFDDPRLLMFALSEYRDVPRHAWVARRMWACNAGGVRSKYKSCSNLTAQLVKVWRSHGWKTARDAEGAYAELVAEFGEVSWPDEDAPLQPEGWCPAEPFRAWLRAEAEAIDRAYQGTGSGVRTGKYKLLAKRTGIGEDTVSEYVRGIRRGAAPMVQRSTVERALESSSATFQDLYGSHP